MSEWRVRGVVLPEALPPYVPPPGAPLFPWPHPNVWWTILWCVIYLLCTQVTGGMVGAVVLVGIMFLAPQLIATEPGAGPMALFATPGGSVFLGVAIAAAHGLGILFSLGVLRVVVGREWPRRVGLRLPAGRHLLLILVAFPSMVLVANGSVEVLRLGAELVRSWFNLPQPSGTGWFEQLGEVMKGLSSWPWALAILLIGVFPGIGEELWCRAFLGRGLVGRYGFVWGVLFASFFFGLIHLHPVQGAVAALIGLWLHFVYLATRSLWAPILLHFLNNSLAVTVMRFESVQALEASPGAIPGFVYLTGCVLFLAVAAALYQSRARLVGEDGGPPTWQPDFPSVEWPPEGSGTRVGHGWPTREVTVLTIVAFVAFVAACVVAALR
jgi:membrane protease YdiL (CAAX protease family)